MEKRNYCLYIHISPSRKKYVGITCRKPQKRWNYGKGYVGNDYFMKAIEKYGWNNFDHIILCVGLTREQASELEIEIINMLDTTNRDKGYNLDGGGIKQKRMSEETKHKISDAHRGKFTDAQWEAAIARRGKPGHPHTEETKNHLREVHLGKKMSAESCVKMSIAHKGQIPSNLDQLKEANKARWRKVEQYTMQGEYVATYENIREAGTSNKINEASIGQCCRGKYKHAGGYIWKYVS